jgi:hypothetical protein
MTGVRAGEHPAVYVGGFSENKRHGTGKMAYSCVYLQLSSSLA